MYPSICPNSFKIVIYSSRCPNPFKIFNFIVQDVPIHPRLQCTVKDVPIHSRLQFCSSNPFKIAIYCSRRHLRIRHVFTFNFRATFVRVHLNTCAIHSRLGCARTLACIYSCAHCFSTILTYNLQGMASAANQEVATHILAIQYG